MDQNTDMGEIPTQKMIKKAEQAKNPHAVKVPNFLKQSLKSGKRVKSSYGSPKTPFEHDWGICAHDSVLGSPFLVLD